MFPGIDRTLLEVMVPALVLISAAAVLTSTFLARRNVSTVYQGLPIYLALLVSFLIFGGFHFHQQHVRHQQVVWLLAHGEKVAAQVTGVKENTSIRINYRSPWVVFASWQDPQTRQTYNYKSSNVWSDPTARLSAHPTVDVYVDPGDPTRYVMDLTPILDSAPPPNPSVQMSQMQQEIEQLHKQVNDLKNKK